MRISTRHNGTEIVEFTELKVSGQQAVGGYGFIFTLQGAHRGFEPSVVIFDIRLSLSSTDPRKPIEVSIPSSNQLITCHKYPQNREQIHFETVFTKEQINALEEYRKENDLRLNLWLRSLCSKDNTLLAGSDTTEIAIPREQWLKALKDAGFRQTLLFEISLPEASDDILSRYAKAQEFIEIGHYKDAVMQCRLIIECIEKLRNDKKKSIEANKMAYSSERQEMTAEQRMLSLREQLKNICQLGGHGDESFTRSQAKAVLGMTMALMAEPTVGVRKLNLT